MDISSIRAGKNKIYLNHLVLKENTEVLKNRIWKERRKEGRKGLRKEERISYSICAIILISNNKGHLSLPLLMLTIK
jgi:hypothetical protein